ncbi:MAG: M28 family peptidase [Acidobacteria bacterium]|nr:MAG: M28 family peptidase [Acidobacteriota bacterium]
MLLRSIWHRLYFGALALACTLAAPLADDQDHEKILLSNSRQLIFDGVRSGEGYFSYDGSLLVFQSEREPGNPFFQIYLMDMETGHTRRVSPGNGRTTCAWVHPSNQKVMFASTHLDPQAPEKQRKEYEQRAAGKARTYGWDYDEYYDLFVRDLKTQELTQLTHERGYDAEGCYSPDGKTIVFASNREGYTAQLSEKDKAIFEKDPSYMMDIYLMNADGSNVRKVTQERGYDGGPFFNRDGSKICWRRFNEDGSKAEIYLMNADGSNQRRITNMDAMSWAPFFHPSGDYLIFATNLHGFTNFELYLVDPDGKSQPVRVTTTEGFDGLPVFSPDGRRLVWTSNRNLGRNAQLFTADWNDAEARRLLQFSSTTSSKPAGGAEATSGIVEKTRPAISIEDLRLHVTALASEEMAGRLTGTKGEALATAYVADVFKGLGLVPAGQNGTFFQEFEFTAGVSPGPKNRLTLSNEKQPASGPAPKLDADWRPLGLSKTGDFGPAPVVFAGYGMVAPASEGNEAYDSFAGLDLKDKWVLVFRFLPEEVSAERRQHLARFSNLRYKAMAVREKGGLGLLVVSGPRSKVKEQLVKMTFDASLAGSGVAALSITDDVAGKILAGSGKSLDQLQAELDSGKAVAGFLVPGATVQATVDILHEKRKGRNVLARLPSGRPGASAVIVGAHIDHLGDGSGTNSLAREDEKGKPHYGADDNASGTASILEIAQYLADRKARGALSLQKDVIFGAWSGEELGLLGSAHFAQTFPDGKERASLRPEIAAYLNLDMVGRLDKNLVLQGVGSSSIWTGEIERRNAVVGLPLVTQNESYLPTDATSFYLKKVPILSAFTGAHQDYHTPRDTADKLNYEGNQKIARLMALITESLVQNDQLPDYKEMEKPKSTQTGGRRVYLGTIPDFGQGNEVVGVKLSGVQKGGPAEQSGIQAGDIIVELAGKTVANIYDYQYALQALKVGEPAKIVVQRGTERLNLTITPGSRD